MNAKANVLAFTENLRTNSPSCTVHHQDTAPFYTDLTLLYSIIIFILCTVIGGDEINMLLIFECHHVVEHVLFSLYCTVMRKLHLKEGVVTEEECRGINKEGSQFNLHIWASDLSLVLCTKSEEQCKVAIKTLDGYLTRLAILTLRYLSGWYIDSYYSA